MNNDGTIAALTPLEALHEARIGVMCKSDFPNEEQYDSIEELAQLAVGCNPAIIMTFDEGTAPFMARFLPKNPLHNASAADAADNTLNDVTAAVDGRQLSSSAARICEPR